MKFQYNFKLKEKLKVIYHKQIYFLINLIMRLFLIINVLNLKKKNINFFKPNLFIYHLK